MLGNLKPRFQLMKFIQAIKEYEEQRRDIIKEYIINFKRRLEIFFYIPYRFESYYCLCYPFKDHPLDNSLYKISNTKLDNINPPCVTVVISNITMLYYYD